MSIVGSFSLNGAGGSHYPILEANGFSVRLAREGANLYTENDLIEELKGCVAVVAGSEPYTPRVLKANPQLRVIARTGVGFDAVHLQTCDEMGIVVCTTPGVNHHAVAEHTIAMLMALGRGFPKIDHEIRRNEWKRVAYPRIMGQTIGIMGLGRIGQAVATRAVGLGMKVLVYEPYPNKDFVEKWGLELVGLEDIVRRSDFLTLHLPALPETKGMFNKAMFAKMKPTSVIINTARGALINEPDLIEALQTGVIRAAGLDVFAVEPLPTDSPLLKMENVMLAGHVAGLDQESHFDTFKMSAESIVSLKTGGWPKECVVNLKGVTGWKW